jgi:hypothetical protein
VAQYYSDLYSMTPGSEVADQLQNILARKRNEARQSMLDDLSRRQAESQMNYQQENIESLKSQRTSEAALRDQQVKDAAAKTKAAQDRMAAIKAIDVTKLPAELQAVWPVISASEDPSVISNALGKYMTPDKVGKAYMLDEATKKYYTPNGQQYTGDINSYDKVTPIPRPPVGPASLNTPQLFQVPDPEHPGQFISHWLRPGEQPNEHNRVNTTLRKGNEPPPVKPVQLSPSDLQNLAKARELATDIPGNSFLGIHYGGSTADAAAKARYDTMLSGMLAKYQSSPEVLHMIQSEAAKSGVSPDVSDTLTAVMQEDPSVSNDEILANTSFDTPAEMENFKTLLYKLRRPKG